MRRYIIRCADFSSYVSFLSWGEEIPRRVPIGAVGISISPSVNAECAVTLYGGCGVGTEYTRAVISHLLASRLGYPLGVYSLLEQGRESELEIGATDRDICSIPIPECEELFTKKYEMQDGVSLLGTDIEAYGETVRIIETADARAFSLDTLRSLTVYGKNPPADVSLALSADSSAVILSSCHPIPPSAITATSFYLSRHYPLIDSFSDVYTSTRYTVRDGRIILSFWCGEIV